MDPKTLASLDPKLRETYERVMGNTQVPGNTTPVAPSVGSALTPPTPTPEQNLTTPIVNANSSVPEQLPTANPFATPDFEAVNTNPALSSSTTDSSAFPNTAPDLNSDGLSNTLSAQAPSVGANTAVPMTSGAEPFVSPFANPDLGNSPQAPLPTVGANTVDMAAFNLNPMGQKTDSSIPVSQSVTPAAAEAAPTTPLPAIGVSVPQPKSASPMMRILYIVAGAVFFLIYTFFWLKLFKFPLPF